MKTAASLAALPLLAAGSATALGIIDNLPVFNKLASVAHDHSGEYKIQNVASGKYLYFDRPGDTTNLITGNDDSQTVTLGQDSAYGQSGVKWDTWSGTYLRGLEKCMSAQWGEGSDGTGIDIAAVSYACKVGGSTDGTDSLEVAKQFWKLVPCGSSSSGDDDDDDEVSIQLNAAKASGSKAASTAEFTKASDDDSSAATATSSASSSTQSVDPKDRTTWVCRHEGKWLARHPAYVWEAGHVECEDELKAYQASQRRMVRRSRVPHAAALNARQKRAEQTYCIIAVDHLTDMTTRALTPNHIETAGGYTSLELANWDETDPYQHWRLIAA
ncbi:hypothetical protein JCM10449v2_006918 [Rhodotorula kratochvilovae]